MIFKKEEFDFLKSYNVVADSKSFLNDKLYINFSKDKGRVIFAQFSNKFNVITSLNKTIQDDNFSIVIETSQFNSLISLLPKESDINITEGKIIFGESAYELQKFDGDYSIAELFIDTIESVRKSKVTVNDLKKLVVMKTYAGVDDLETIALMDGKFLASNRTDITGVINTSNDISIEKFFPLEIANIIAFNSIDSIDLFNVKINDQDVSYFVIGSTYFLINEKDYSLENIFSDEISNNLSYSKLKGNGLNASILGPIILDNNTELKKYVENVLSTNSDKPIVKFKNMQINVLKLEENFDKFKIFIKNVLGWAKDTVQGINISHQKRLRRF